MVAVLQILECSVSEKWCWKSGTVKLLYWKTSCGKISVLWYCMS